MEPTVDLSLHPPQPHSQTLLVCNRLLSATADQLNTFAATCEEKLITMHHKMQRLETGVKLLESKLNTLPGQSAATAGATGAAGAAASADGGGGSSSDGGTAAAGTAAAAAAGAPPPPPPPPPPGAAAAGENSATAAADQVAAPEEPPPPPEEPKLKIKDDPRFAKYFKMVNFGVPKAVVVIKFGQETGFDAALLDDPDAAAPPGGSIEEEDGSDDDD